MAITLVDGLPGSGKTQFAIKAARDLAAKDAAKGRRVFYASGNDSLKFTPAGDALGWTKIVAAEWAACPDGSIIIIDEVQFLWGPRSSGSKVPEHIALLATHRHRGFDFFVVTQDGSLIDQNVRKICSPYVHLERPFNAGFSKVWTFPNFCQWSSLAEQGRAEKSRHMFDKSIWGLYESATVHTHAAKVPRRVWWIPACFVVILGGGWYVYHWLSGFGVAAKPAAAKVVPGAAAPGQLPGLPAASEPRRKLTAAEWLADRRPRVPELPHTAPLYDDLTKPVSFPVVSACVVGANKFCSCYSQQGTRMDVSPSFCLSFVERGAFDHFRPDLARGSMPQRNGYVQAPQNGPSLASQSPVVLRPDPR